MSTGKMREDGDAHGDFDHVIVIQPYWGSAMSVGDLPLNNESKLKNTIKSFTEFRKVSHVATLSGSYWHRLGAFSFKEFSGCGKRIIPQPIVPQEDSWSLVQENELVPVLFYCHGQRLGGLHHLCLTMSPTHTELTRQSILLHLLLKQLIPQNQYGAIIYPEFGIVNDQRSIAIPFGSIAVSGEEFFYAHRNMFSKLEDYGHFPVGVTLCKGMDADGKQHDFSLVIKVVSDLLDDLYKKILNELELVVRGPRRV